MAAFVLVPFAVLSKTAFIAERPLGWVVGSGVRLMVLTLVLGVGNNVFQALKVPAGQTVTTYQAFCIALAALLLMAMSLVASRLATDMITGGPSLGAGTAINTMGAAYNMSVTASTSKPAVLAVKAASTVPTKGLFIATSVGKAAYGGIRKAVGGAAAASTTTARSPSTSHSTTSASNVSVSKSPGTGGSSNPGGKTA